MSIADMLGFGPKRANKPQDDGTVIVTVTPPAVLQLKGRPEGLKLTNSQFKRYLMWVGSGGMMIQDALPDLSASDREYLMSGLSDEDMLTMEGDPE